MISLLSYALLPPKLYIFVVSFFHLCLKSAVTDHDFAYAEVKLIALALAEIYFCGTSVLSLVFEWPSFLLRK